MARGGFGVTRIPRRGTAPPGGIRAPEAPVPRPISGPSRAPVPTETPTPPAGAEVPLPPDSPRPAEVQKTLESFRNEILATVIQALSQSPAVRTGSHAQDSSRRSKSRRRRRRHSSGSSSSSSSGSSDLSVHVEDEGPLRPIPLAGPPVIQCSDDRFTRILDYHTYRLRNRSATYGIREARKMGRVARNMHSFAGFQSFSGKEGLKVFTWLRKFVKVCDDNGVSEGMALYLIPHFLSEDAELRYTRILPDSTSASDGSIVRSYPEAVNWFLETYAEPHTLALAQDRFSRATKEPEETIEAFAVRLRGLTELCGNVHTEGTMKQQLIQGLPEYLRTNAFVYNFPERTYQQLVTFTSGKYKAATDVIRMAQGSGMSSKSGPSGPTRRSADLAPKRTVDSSSVLAVNPVGPIKILKGPHDKEAEKAESDQAYGFTGPTQRFVGVRAVDSRRPYRCYLCWKSGHMAHQCDTLTEAQRKAVCKTRDSFMAATRGRSQSTEADALADHRFHRKIRVALVQAICEGINVSDDEVDEMPPFPEKEGLRETEPSGNELRGLDPKDPVPTVPTVSAHLLLRLLLPLISRGSFRARLYLTHWCVHRAQGRPLPAYLP